MITKEDPIAYSKMIEDIDDLKINGDKIKPWLIEDSSIIEKIVEPKKITEHNDKTDFSYSKQIKKKLLELLRD